MRSGSKEISKKPECKSPKELEKVEKDVQTRQKGRLGQ